MTGKRPFTLRLFFFVVFCIGLLVWSLMALGAFELNPGITVSAVFPDASGLLVGSQILVSGVQVGRVTRIELTTDLEALVHFTVSRDVALSRGTMATLRARSLLGEKVIALAATPPTDSTDRLSAGDRLKQVATDADMLALAARAGDAMASVQSVATDFKDLAGALVSMKEKLDAAGAVDDLSAIGDLARRADSFLAGNEEAITRALSAVENGAAALARFAEESSSSVERVDRILAKMEEENVSSELLATARQTREHIASTAAEVNKTLQGLQRLLGADSSGSGEGELARNLRETGEAAREFFAGAGGAAREIERLSSRADESLQLLDKALEGISKLTPAEIRRILQEEGVKVILLQ